ncbi:unnamed protein product, partial [Symbiodinium sp. CCMP2456]
MLKRFEALSQNFRSEMQELFGQETETAKDVCRLEQLVREMQKDLEAERASVGATASSIRQYMETWQASHVATVFGSEEASTSDRTRCQGGPTEAMCAVDLQRIVEKVLEAFFDSAVVLLREQVQPAMLSAAISSVSSDLSGAAGSDLADHFLPSHLARAQEAYNRVSEHLSNIKSSRAKAAKGLTPSPAPDVPRDLGVAQLESAMEELLAGRRSMQDSRAAHLALRSQITAELQSSKLALWEPQVPNILAASGISTNGADTREHAPAEESPLRAAQDNEAASPRNSGAAKSPPSAPCTPAVSPARITPKDNIRDIRERPSPPVRRVHAVQGRPELEEAQRQIAALQDQLEAGHGEMSRLRADLAEAQKLKSEEEKQLVEFKLLRAKENELQSSKMEVQQLQAELEELRTSSRQLETRCAQHQSTIKDKSEKIIALVKQLDHEVEQVRLLSDENNTLRLELGRDAEYLKVVAASADPLSYKSAAGALAEDLLNEEQQFREDLRSLAAKYPGLPKAGDHYNNWCELQISRVSDLHRSFLHRLQDHRSDFPEEVKVEFSTPTEEAQKGWMQQEAVMTKAGVEFQEAEQEHNRRWEEHRLKLTFERDSKVKQLLDQAERSQSKAEKQLLMQQAKLYGQRIDAQLDRAWEDQRQERETRWSLHQQQKQELRQKIKGLVDFVRTHGVKVLVGTPDDFICVPGSLKMVARAPRAYELWKSHEPMQKQQSMLCHPKLLQPVSCYEVLADDEKTWSWTKESPVSSCPFLQLVYLIVYCWQEFLEMVGPDHVMGLAIGNELELLADHADQTCIE